MKKTKKKIFWLKLFSFFFLLSPITGVVIYNAPHYFTTKPGMVLPQHMEVSIGAILAMGSGVLILLKKTKPLQGSRGLILALVLSIFLKSILNDLVLILSALTVGNLIYEMFQPKINHLKRIAIAEEDADINALAIKNVLQEEPTIKIRARNGRV